jgi:hypothetical protein
MDTHIFDEVPGDRRTRDWGGALRILPRFLNLSQPIFSMSHGLFIATSSRSQKVAMALEKSRKIT